MRTPGACRGVLLVGKAARLPKSAPLPVLLLFGLRPHPAYGPARPGRCSHRRCCPRVASALGMPAGGPAGRLAVGVADGGFAEVPCEALLRAVEMPGHGGPCRRR